MIKSIITRLPWFGRIYREWRIYKTPHPPGHFANPYPDLKFIRENSERIFDLKQERFLGINLSRANQDALLQELEAHLGQVKYSDAQAAGARYYFDNAMFSYGDGTFLRLMLEKFKPKNVIEVGSGFSSAIMLDFNDEQQSGTKANLTFIEPYPDRLYSLLKKEDEKHCDIIVDKIQNVDLKIFDRLTDGDFLFLDTSHIFKTGSDLNFEFFEILPRLKKGVIVHIHDIHFPFEYPQSWVEDQRAYNEIYILRAFLMYNQAFEIMLWPNYLMQKKQTYFKEKIPHVLKNTGGSIWLRKVAED